MDTAASDTQHGHLRLSAPHVRRLEDLGHADSATAGHKAANLGLLLQQGFPVPPGVVVEAGEPDDALTARVAEALSVLGDGPLAVRSSALAEDLADASFAGQYETVLGVSGARRRARRRPQGP